MSVNRPQLHGKERCINNGNLSVSCNWSILAYYPTKSQGLVSARDSQTRTHPYYLAFSLEHHDYVTSRPVLPSVLGVLGLEAAHLLCARRIMTARWLPPDGQKNIAAVVKSSPPIPVSCKVWTGPGISSSQGSKEGEKGAERRSCDRRHTHSAAQSSSYSASVLCHSVLMTHAGSSSPPLLAGHCPSAPPNIYPAALPLSSRGSAVPPLCSRAVCMDDRSDQHSRSLGSLGLERLHADRRDRVPVLSADCSTHRAHFQVWYA